MLKEYEGSALERWADEGSRHTPAGGSLVNYFSPCGRFRLTNEEDSPVEGVLIELWHQESETLLARYIDIDTASASAHAAGIAGTAEQYLPLVDAD